MPAICHFLAQNLLHLYAIWQWVKYADLLPSQPTVSKQKAGLSPPTQMQMRAISAQLLRNFQDTCH
jgi:hypothetical protein